MIATLLRPAGTMAPAGDNSRFDDARTARPVPAGCDLPSAAG